MPFKKKCKEFFEDPYVRLGVVSISLATLAAICLLIIAFKYPEKLPRAGTFNSESRGSTTSNSIALDRIMVKEICIPFGRCEKFLVLK